MCIYTYVYICMHIKICTYMGPRHWWIYSPRPGFVMRKQRQIDSTVVKTSTPQTNSATKYDGRLLICSKYDPSIKFENSSYGKLKHSISKCVEYSRAAFQYYSCALVFRVVLRKVECI